MSELNVNVEYPHRTKHIKDWGTPEWRSFITACSLPLIAKKRHSEATAGKNYKSDGYSYQFVAERLQQEAGPYWHFCKSEISGVPLIEQKGPWKANLIGWVELGYYDGGKWIMVHKTTEMPGSGISPSNAADALKSAGTWAFKRTCAMDFGIGADAYKGEALEEEQYAQAQEQVRQHEYRQPKREYRKAQPSPKVSVQPNVQPGTTQPGMVYKQPIYDTVHIEKSAQVQPNEHAPAVPVVQPEVAVTNSPCFPIPSSVNDLVTKEQAQPQQAEGPVKQDTVKRKVKKDVKNDDEKREYSPIHELFGRMTSYKWSETFKRCYVATVLHRSIFRDEEGGWSLGSLNDDEAKKALDPMLVAEHGDSSLLSDIIRDAEGMEAVALNDIDMTPGHEIKSA